MQIAFVFDMDGVLFDSHPAHRMAWRELLWEAGREISDAELDFVMEGATREEMLRHFLGPLSPEQMAFYANRKDAIFRKEEARVSTVPGLENFLDRAESAAIPMAVASSGSRVRVQRMLEMHGLADRFPVVLTGDDVRVGKKSAAIFLRAAAELHVRPGEVVVLEDAVHAVESAKKAGMKCVAIAAAPRRVRMITAGADLVAGDFTEFNLADVFDMFEPAPAA